MKLFFLFFINIYLVSSNKEIDKTISYQECFTLPPKIINSYERYNSYDCPTGYIKYQEYHEYLNVKSDDNCIISYGSNINTQLSENNIFDLIKIYAVCCK
jgi:hypothetical protein